MASAAFAAESSEETPSTKHFLFTTYIVLYIFQRAVQFFTSTFKIAEFPSESVTVIVAFSSETPLTYISFSDSFEEHETLATLSSEEVADTLL